MSIRSQIVQIIVDFAEVTDVDTQGSLAEHGLDSLDIAELGMEIEDELDVSIPDAQWNAFNNIDDLIAYVEAKKGA